MPVALAVHRQRLLAGGLADMISILGDFNPPYPTTAQLGSSMQTLFN